MDHVVRDEHVDRRTGIRHRDGVHDTVDPRPRLDQLEAGRAGTAVRTPGPQPSSTATVSSVRYPLHPRHPLAAKVPGGSRRVACEINREG